MEKIKTIVCILSVFMGLNVFAQKNNPDPVWLNPSSKLIYHFKSITNEYDFIVSAITINKGVSFKWKMTEPLNYSGEIKMLPSALDSSVRIINFFTDKSSLQLSDRSSVWVSKKIFNSLKNQQPLLIQIDKQSDTIYYRGSQKYEISINDNKLILDVIIAETEAGYRFSILDNAQNPLIVEMDLGFSIELLKIETNK